MLLIAGMAILATTRAVQAGGQVRTIDLTGAPIATITEPLVFPAGFNELPGNRAVVIDQKDNRLALVNFTNGSSADLGRHGGGPNEFQRIDKAFPWPGGATLVPDPANNRALVISAGGDLSSADYSRQTIGVAGAGQIGGADRAGKLYVYGVAPGQGGQDSLPIIRWDPVSHRTDTLAWWPIARVIVGTPRMVNGRMQATLSNTSLFPDRGAWRVLPAGGVTVVHPSPYRIELVDAAGRHHFGPIVARERIPIDGAEIAAWNAQGRPLTRADVPPSYPPFVGSNDVFVAPDGGVWVERSRRVADSTAVYDVFDTNGRLAAQARLRPNSRIIGIGTRNIYIVRQTTDDDFWHLEQWRRPN